MCGFVPLFHGNGNNGMHGEVLSVYGRGEMAAMIASFAKQMEPVVMGGKSEFFVNLQKEFQLFGVNEKCSKVRCPHCLEWNLRIK